MGPTRAPRRQRAGNFLDGQLLVAMPVMTDRRFARSVIYMCAHSKDGAMGLILNQLAPHIGFPALMRKLGIPAPSGDGEADALPGLSVHIGGPVETGRGFVLHTSDYFSEEATLAIDGGICLTATIDILKSVADGNGPRRALLALGYAGWSPGQLENEIHANGWLNCPADLDLVFDPDLDGKYARALAKIGVDPSHLVSGAGHA